MSSGPDDAFDLDVATTTLLADRSDVAMAPPSAWPATPTTSSRPGWS